MSKLLNSIDGHKSAIGATVNIILLWAVNQGWLPEEVATLVISIASVWTGVAVVHNVAKTKKR